MPDTFYWLSDGKIRKITKVDNNSWNVINYRQMYNQWTLHDNVGEDTAKDYFDDEYATILTEVDRSEAEHTKGKCLLFGKPIEECSKAELIHGIKAMDRSVESLVQTVRSTLRLDNMGVTYEW